MNMPNYLIDTPSHMHDQDWFTPEQADQVLQEAHAANVRQIEGTVNKILAFQELMGEQVDVDTVTRAVRDMFKDKTEFLPSTDVIIEEVGKFYNLSPQDIRGQTRTKDVALAIELFTEGSLNTFAKPTNVDTDARIVCYDIRDLGKQLLPVGMLVVLDSVFNRVIRNRALGRNTWVYIDEIYILFQHEYSANFLFTLWKRVRKYGALCTGATQNVEDLLQSHTARTMLANSEFLVMLNQAATDRAELARLLNISDNQLSYITNVDFGRGLIKCGSAIVPFMDVFPKNRLYKLMTTKLSETGT